MKGLRCCHARMSSNELTQDRLSVSAECCESGAGVLVGLHGLLGLDNCAKSALCALENCGKGVDIGKRMGL